MYVCTTTTTTTTTIHTPQNCILKTIQQKMKNLMTAQQKFKKNKRNISDQEEDNTRKKIMTKTIPTTIS